MSRIIIAGIEYDGRAALRKAIERVPLGPYFELRDAGIDLEALDEETLHWRELLACWVYLLRRGADQQVTFAQVAAETIAEDVLIGGPDDAPEPAPEPAAEPPDPPRPGDDDASVT